jgi:hypothetical protein
MHPYTNRFILAFGLFLFTMVLLVALNSNGAIYRCVTLEEWVDAQLVSLSSRERIPVVYGNPYRNAGFSRCQCGPGSACGQACPPGTVCSPGGECYYPTQSQYGMGSSCAGYAVQSGGCAGSIYSPQGGMSYGAPVYSTPVYSGVYGVAPAVPLAAQGQHIYHHGPIWSALRSGRERRAARRAGQQTSYGGAYGGSVMASVGGGCS